MMRLWIEFVEMRGLLSQGHMMEKVIYSGKRLLFKHYLDFEPTWKFTYDSLYDVNQLSTELLNVIDYKSGDFFTLLPKEANIERLYKFKSGLMLPQSEESYYENGEKSTFTRIPTIDEEIADLILNEIKLENLCCIFDDVTRYPSEKNTTEIFKNHGVSYETEVYYFLNYETASEELIAKCLSYSNAFGTPYVFFVKKVF
jgi:hypothetical protein